LFPYKLLLVVRVLKSPRGFSLIEVMIAVFLVGGTALMISNFSTTFQTTTSISNRACQAYSQSLISLVKEETPYRAILDFRSGDGGSKVPGNFVSSKVLPGTKYQNPNGDNAYDINVYLGDPARGVRMQNFQLIQGSVRTVAELYNGQNIRCNFTPYPVLTNQLPVPSAFLSLPNQGNVRVSYRIEPFSISSGINYCSAAAPTPLRVYPMPAGQRGTTPYLLNVYEPDSGVPPTGGYREAIIARDETSGASGQTINDISVANAQMATLNQLPNYTVGDKDMGLRLSVQTIYSKKDRDGITRDYSCISSQDFAYPADNNAPPVPDIAISVLDQNSSIADAAVSKGVALWNHCGSPSGSPSPRPDNSGTARIQVGYSNAALSMVEPGVQLLCKDLSFIKRPLPIGTNPGNWKRCFTGASAGSFVQQPYTTNTSFQLKDTTLDAPNHQYEFNADMSKRSKAWVPCELMQQCGVDPSTAALQLDGHIWQLDYYQKLPFGCHMDFEVVGVDTAGNRSDAATPKFLDRVASGAYKSNYGNPAYDYQARAVEIHYPFCGSGNGDPSYNIKGLGYYCEPRSEWNNPVPGYPPASGPGGWSDVPEIQNGYYTCADTCCIDAPGSQNCRPWTM